jgi:hypothetical protein
MTYRVAKFTNLGKRIGCEYRIVKRGFVSEMTSNRYGIVNATATTCSEFLK